MSRALAIIALFVASLPLRAAPAQEPQIVLEESSHDFGEVGEGEVLRHVFVFRNTGDAPLRAKGG